MEWKNTCFKWIEVDDRRNYKNKLRESYFRYMIDTIVQNIPIKPNFRLLN